jgi:hypothetical protein
MRVALIKVTKYRTVYIKKADYEKAKKEPLFVTAVQLGRVANSIGACQRNYVRITDYGKLTQTKDQIEQLFVLSSLVYEGVKEFFRRKRQLSQLAAWNTHKHQIELLRREKEKGTPYWVMLKEIRDQVMFHFLKTAVEETIEGMEVKDEVKFIVGRKAKIEETIYLFGDDILLKYVFGRPGINGAYIDEKINGLMMYVLGTSNLLRAVTNAFLTEILLSFKADFKRAPLE